MFDVITFGSGTWDIFLELDDPDIIKNKKFIAKKGICFNIGSKIDVEGVEFTSGGGGTNTAVTFRKQGLKTAFAGAVGNDISGKEIIERLKKLKINTSLISKIKDKPTNHSIILDTGTERTILAYRGASEELGIPWKKLKSKWFYLAPLSGNLAKETKKIIDFARVNEIKIAFNPSSSQLDLMEIEDVIEKVDVLILNQEEASMLTKIPYTQEKKIFKQIDRMCPGIAIMTKGDDGVAVSDGTFLYRAKPGRIKVVDKTGAGDSFGSGFVSGLIRFDDIEKAIQLAMANANSCLSKRGAKNGLLSKANSFKNIKIKKRNL